MAQDKTVYINDWQPTHIVFGSVAVAVPPTIRTHEADVSPYLGVVDLPPPTTLGTL